MRVDPSRRSGATPGPRARAMRGAFGSVLRTSALPQVAAALVLACAPPPPGRFPPRDPFTVDTDLQPVSVACHPDADAKHPDRVTCAPEEYISPFTWDHVDNVLFGAISRGLMFLPPTEAANANSLDEVADSAWFTNRIGAHPIPNDELARGGCRPEDYLPDDSPDGSWVIDKGKTEGATPGFRVKIPGKGEYLFKADYRLQPERDSAASAMGSAIYHAVGFNTTCEQIVFVRRAQFALTPGLKTVHNNGLSTKFDEAALDAVLRRVPRDANGRVRLGASKWLDGVSLGPFRYVGTRHDDPNDVIEHEDRRELRGSRVLAAWLNHWDAREENSLDMWIAADPKRPRSSPGIVRHYILDTSDVIGQRLDPPAVGTRLGFVHVVDWAALALDWITLGALERPWDRAHLEPGRERFGYFSARDFVPDEWVPLYPNPAFLRMTERDAAWMARIIARFTEDDLRAIIAAGRFSDPGDSEYVLGLLRARQRIVLARYLTRLSPLTDVHADGRHVCATDLARVWALAPAAQFRYSITAGGRAIAAVPGDAGSVCFDAPAAPQGAYVVYSITNGVARGPLEIHTYDQGAQGVKVVGLARPEG